MPRRNLTAGALLVLAMSLTGLPPAVADTSRDATVAADTPGHHLRNVNSHLCLVARVGSGERPVIQSTCDYSVDTYWPDQYWRLLPVDEMNEYWRVQNTNNHLCVVARGLVESAAVATVCGTAGTWQYADGIWHREYSDKWDAVRFVNYNSGLCLTVRGDQETQAVATTCDEDMANQYWW